MGCGSSTAAASKVAVAELKASAQAKNAEAAKANFSAKGGEGPSTTSLGEFAKLQQQASLRRSSVAQSKEESNIQAVKDKLLKAWTPEYVPEDIRPPQDSPDVCSERATNITLGQILKHQKHLARKTKIICTMGPNCWSEDGLTKLLDAGMTVMRLNFSHGDHAGHLEVLQRFRKVCDSKGLKAAALLDTKGPEVRTAMLKEGKAIELVAGQEVIIEAVGDNYTSFEGYKTETETRIGLSYAKLCQSVQAGNKILLADGSISIEVTEILNATELKGKVMNSKTLGQRKNCNLPGVKVDIPVLTSKDVDDLQNFGCKHKVDFIAASFVQSAADVKYIRKTLDEAGGQNIKIISKIENLEGLNNFDEILNETDGIMVARGDLGMEIPSEKVPVAQKMMITKSNIAGKFVICATQMLESMISNPLPTRAEMTDVANAVYDGVDCVMLSGETANGEFPDKAAATMAAIVANAEVGVDYYSQYSFIRYWATKANTVALSSAEAVFSSTVSMAVAFTEDTTPDAIRRFKENENTEVQAMICVLTSDGSAARLVSKYRPPCPVVVASDADHVLRQSSACFGQVHMKVESLEWDMHRLAEAAVKVVKTGMNVHVRKDVKVIIVKGKDGGSADNTPQVLVLRLGGAMKHKIKSIGNMLVGPSGVPIQRPGVRSLRSTHTSLPLIIKPATNFRSTHILCTMGPKCWSEEMMSKLLDAGLDVMRMNFSHGSHEAHLTVLTTFRKVCAAKGEALKAKGINFAPQWGTLLDTKGPEIRTAMLRDHKPIELVAGQEIIIEAVGDEYTTWEGYKDDKETRIGLSYGKLCQSVRPGNTILLADGTISIEVLQVVDDRVIRGSVLNTKMLGERKNCNLPGVKVDIPVLTSKDIDDLQNFGCKHQVDYVAASFVQSADDVRFIRRILDEAGGDRIKIISKIENAEGLINFDEILQETDGVMVARGDLGMEIPSSKVPLAQKMMITKCNIAGKFVVCATQMLESMITNPRPTRAEMTDVANAVLDGTDCVMLSGETANGDFPVEAVSTMAAICQNAEDMVDTSKRYDFLHNHTPKPMAGAEAICSGVVQTAIDINARAIVCITASGRGPALVSKYRPPCPVFIVTPDETMARHCRSVYGQHAIVFDHAHAEISYVVDMVVEYIKKMGIMEIKPDDQLVVLKRRQVQGKTLYDDQRLVMRTAVVGSPGGAIDVPSTAYPGKRVIFHRSTKIGLDTLLDASKFKHMVRKTKIIATMGPKCTSEEMLGKLLDEGLSVARLNFSHGDHASHGEVLERFRKVCEQRKVHAATLLDTKGPEIRTAMLRDHKPIELTAGQEIIIVAVGDEYNSWEGYKDDKETRIGLSYGKLCQSVVPGNKILLADGTISIEVVQILNDKELKGKVLNTKTLGERKNCNLPGVKVDIPVLTEKDINDLQNFGCKHQVDFVAASFVQSKADVVFIRKVLDEGGGDRIKIISKIENAEGLKNFDEILEVTDGVMVARGDLGMEIPVEKVPLAQKMMITKCNIAGKFVICATQMLESMIENPIPTRAEMTDVANAVFDGVDAVMLSGETANGAYPNMAVKTMADICRSVEIGVNYYQVFDFIRKFTPKPVGTVESVVCTLSKNAVDIRPGMVIVFSEGGKTARLVAKYRPCCPVLVVTSNPKLARYCSVMFSLYAMLLPEPILDLEDMPKAVDMALKEGVRLGLCVAGKEVIVVTSTMVVDTTTSPTPRATSNGVLPLAGVQPVSQPGKRAGDARRATCNDGLEQLPEREMYVTVAPGNLNLDALGILAPHSSAEDPKFYGKTISLRSTIIDFDMVVSDHAPPRKTKICCTLGPSCSDPEILRQMLRAGMNVVRLNMSHGSVEGHGQLLETLKKVSEEEQLPVAVLLELVGAEVRTSYLINKATKERVHKIKVTAGDVVQLYGSDNTHPDHFVGWRTEEGEIRIGVSLPDLADVVKVGSELRVQDGTLGLQVTEVNAQAGVVKAKVLNDSLLEERKRLWVMGVTLHRNVVTDHDYKMMEDVAIKHQVDYIAAGVNNKSEVETIRRYLDDNGGENIKLIAKLETDQSLKNLDDLLISADGLLLARGNLGLAIGPEKVALAQCLVITKANVAGKPVITARQMLESMVSNLRPTRAEMTDVANAVLDHVDCVMLCNETATGKFPVLSLTTASDICRNAEGAANYCTQHSFIRDFSSKPFTTAEATAKSVSRTLIDGQLKLAIVFSENGSAANDVCKYRPPGPVIVISSQPAVIRAQALRFGQIGMLSPTDLTTVTSSTACNDLIKQAFKLAADKGLAPADCQAVVMHGIASADADNEPQIKVVSVSNL